MMKKQIAGFAVIVASALVPMLACSSSDSGTGGGGSYSCDSVSKCPNDPVASQQSKDQCNAGLSSSCGAQFRALGDCGLANQTCGADGKTDSAAFAAACKAQSDALGQCIIGSVDSGGGG